LIYWLAATTAAATATALFFFVAAAGIIVEDLLHGFHLLSVFESDCRFELHQFMPDYSAR
jgi:hypothetical protein